MLPVHRFNLARLGLKDAVTLGQRIRRSGDGASHQDVAAQRIADLLYETAHDPDTGEACCALVRCFQTHPFAALPADLQQAARASMQAGEPAPGLRCLALLATRGLEPAWNQTSASVTHRAIPLPDVAMVENAPMISGLLSQMGVQASHVVSPGAVPLLNPPEPAPYRAFNVFHVEHAEGSPLIPAQQTFVAPYGIRSVVGMGGLMPTGELFAVILFARVHVSRDVATLFRTLALSVKLAFLPFAPNRVFSASTHEHELPV